MQNIQLRSLVDSGAELSLISQRTYDNLKFRPPLVKTKNVALKSANGTDIEVKGSVDLEFKIAGIKLTHNFIVVSNLSRNMILGLDFMVRYGVRLYFDFSKMRIQGAYVPLENDSYIASIARLNTSVTLKPHTVYLVEGKIKDNPYFKTESDYQLLNLDRGFLEDQPEIEVSPIVFKLRNNFTFPLQIVNNSGKHIRLRKGCLVGQISSVKGNLQCNSSANINSVHTTTNNTSHKMTEKEFMDQIIVEDKHKQVVTEMLLKNSDIFAFSDLELRETDLMKAEILTRDNEPINLRPYRLPISQRQMVSDTIDDLLKAGIIRRSFSPWNFPIIVVEKKPDALGNPQRGRVCVDYRLLNSKLIIQHFPLPLIDDLLAELKGTTYFTTLDLRAGFHQIKLSEESKQKTAFSCFKGKYEYNRLPFGLSIGPSVFQNMASRLLQGFESFSKVYMDDILIHTNSNIEDHLLHVQKVLDRIRKHNLRLKLSKCKFLQTELNYLGFIVSSEGIKPDTAKIDAIRSLQPPTSVKQVRSLVGMASWYRRFIPGFSKITEPLVALTKKYARFKWDSNCQKAFEFLKESLTVVPLLAYPDPTKEYILYTDASDTCVGACLCQETEEMEELIPGMRNERPIYFISQKLSPSLIKMPTVMKEAYAIHYALNKLHYYLWNAKFTIRTDHKPLEYLFTSEQKNRKVQAWSLTLASYDCRIEYLKGTDNVCADLLSRNYPAEMDETCEPEIPVMEEKTFEVNALNSNTFDPVKFINVNIDPEEDTSLPSLEDFDNVNEQGKDRDIKEIKEKLENGRADKNLYRKYIIIDEVVYYLSQVDDEPNLRLYVPKHLQDKVLEQYHDLNGHMAVDKTFNAIRQKYYWPNLYKQIKEKLDSCVTCKVRNMKAQKGELQETNTPPFPFACISLDLSGPFKPSMSGNVYIASFVDIYSGWIEAFPIPDKKAETVLNLLLEEIIPRFSCPLSITTDNGKEFVNNAFEETLKYLNIVHIKTSTYSPSSNPMVERSHATLNSIVAKKMKDSIDIWDLQLNSALSAMRTNISKTTNMSPFFILYNREPVLPLDNLLKPRRKYNGEEFHKIALENQHKNFMTVVKNIKKTKNKQAEQVAKKRKPKETLQVGDSVYYKNHTKSSKLENNWLTHFVIIKQTTPVSFVIRNQLSGKLVRAHANSLRLAKTEWQIPPQDGPKLRSTKLATSLPNSDTDDSDVSKSSDATIIYDPYCRSGGQMNHNEGIPSDVEEAENSDSVIERDTEIIPRQQPEEIPKQQEILQKSKQ